MTSSGKCTHHSVEEKNNVTFIFNADCKHDEGVFPVTNAEKLVSNETGNRLDSKGIRTV